MANITQKVKIYGTVYLLIKFLEDNMILKPGAGWKQLRGPVWEHKSGVRIHVSGLILKTEFHGILGPIDEFSYHSFLRKLILVNGGNKKRGLMAFARNV